MAWDPPIGNSSWQFGRYHSLTAGGQGGIRLGLACVWGWYTFGVDIQLGLAYIWSWHMFGVGIRLGLAFVWD